MTTSDLGHWDRNIVELFVPSHIAAQPRAAPENLDRRLTPQLSLQTDHRVLPEERKTKLLLQLVRSRLRGFQFPRLSSLCAHFFVSPAPEVLGTKQ